MEKMTYEKKSFGEKKMNPKKTPGAGYMKGREPNSKDPSCPSSGYIYGHY